jgi:hypothetical protein
MYRTLQDGSRSVQGISANILGAYLTMQEERIIIKGSFENPQTLPDSNGALQQARISIVVECRCIPHATGPFTFCVDLNTSGRAIFLRRLEEYICR